MLVLLDLSATFYTANHGILLERLRITFGVENLALDWSRSYLASRRQHVRCSGKWSALVDVICCVPQGSFLGPILVIIYTTNWSRLLQNTGYRCTSMLMIARYTAPVALMLLSGWRPQCQCVDSISSWMWSNRLQLNADKTEVMWCSSTRKLPQLPSCPLSVDGAVSSPVSAI